MSAVQVLKIGIVGLGRLGRRHAENLLRRVPGAALVAACSPLESELTWAKEKLGISHLYRDYEALLPHDGLDAVFLVTPTSSHAKHIFQALRSGKHVFCEKPLSLEMEDCRRVNAAAALHPQLKVMIGFVRRFDASYLPTKRFSPATLASHSWCIHRLATSTIRTVSSSNSRPPAAAFFWTAACTTSTWRDGCWATRNRCGFLPAARLPYIRDCRRVAMSITAAL